MAKMYLIECSDAKLRKVLETGNIYPQKISGDGDIFYVYFLRILG